MTRNRVRQERQKVGISQTKLACLIGIAQGTLSDIERGRFEPWPKVKRDLAEALNTTEEELFPVHDKAKFVLNRLLNVVAGR